METVLRLRRASRAQLSRVSGISSPTVSRIVDGLLSSGVLMEADGTAAVNGYVTLADRDKAIEASATVASTVGRPSAPLEFDNRKPRFLAIHLGVNQTRMARAPIALPDHDDWEAIFDTPTTVGEWIQQLARHSARLPVNDLQAVVLSVPGVVDEANGRVLFSPNLKWTESEDLRQIIDRVVSRRAALICVQEIRALALGHHAANVEVSDFLLIDFGTGVGGAALVRHKPYVGPLPLSGEIGHTPVLGNTRRCGCGSIGCVETLVSRRGMLQSAREHDGIDSWAALVAHVEEHGLPEWMKHALDAAAVCIAASLNILGMRQIVLTGCIVELPTSVIDYLGAAIRADTMWARFGNVDICTAPRRRLAGLIHTAIARTLLHTAE